MNMIDGWPAPWWVVALIVFLAVSGFAAWCWAAARGLEWLWQSRYARLADSEPYPGEPAAYPVDPPPGYHWEVHDENWLEELPAERTGEQLGFNEDEAGLSNTLMLESLDRHFMVCDALTPTQERQHRHHGSCPGCEPEDRREPLDLAEDARTWAWGPGGPASLPVFPPAISAAIDQLHEAGERHYLASPPVPDWVAEILHHQSTAAAVDSIVMKAIQ